MSGYRLVLIPTIVGLALALIWQMGALSNPILRLRVDVGTLLLLIGIATSAIWGLMLSARMQTQRRYKRLMDQLIATQSDAHTRFLRRLDHELKNPLTAIRVGLANLYDVNAAPLVGIRTQVDRLARLTADLRKLADLETQPLESEPVDLAGILTDLDGMARERAVACQVRLRLALPQAPWPMPPVAGDRDLLFLALHNLLDNAFKFSRPGDTIEMRMFEDGASVVVQIADTGPGVSDVDLAHLGEELYRGENLNGVEGSGLGLALVKAIVGRHHGTVTIKSRVARGTEVQLRLPVS